MLKMKCLLFNRPKKIISVNIEIDKNVIQKVINFKLKELS